MPIYFSAAPKKEIEKKNERSGLLIYVLIWVTGHGTTIQPKFRKKR